MKTIEQIHQLRLDAEQAIAKILHDLAVQTGISDWELETKTVGMTKVTSRGAVEVSKNIVATVNLTARF